MQNISPATGAPAARKRTISPALRSQLVLILLPFVLVLLMGASIAGLQTASLKGIQLGYPAPKVLITSDPGGSTISTAVNQPVSLSAGSPGRDLVYSWDFGDGTTGYGATVSHNYQQVNESNNFIYTASVTVQDVMGRTSTASVSVKVLPPAPTATFTETAGYSYYGYYPFSFDATSSVVGTQSATYNWDFGDGTTPDQTTGPTDSHTYSTAGSYTVTLSITDSASQQSNTYSQTIYAQ